MYYCISLYDLPMMEIRKIILQRHSSKLIAYFHHSRFPDHLAFCAHIDFQMRDKKKWYTHLEIYEDGDVTINQAVKDRVREQLTDMFMTHFDRLIEEGRLW